MAISSEAKQKVKNLVILGKKQGYLTLDDLLDVFPEVEDDLQLLEYIIANAQDDEIEIIEPRVDESTNEEKKNKMTFEEKIKILKQIKSHVSTEPIRAYLQEIGRIPLLSAEEEVILAKRFEKGNEEIYKVIEKLAKEKFHEDYVKAWKRIINNEERNIEVEKAKQRIEEKDRRYSNKAIREGMEAQRLLIKANLRLVVSIAKNYSKRG